MGKAKKHALAGAIYTVVRDAMNEVLQVDSLSIAYKSSTKLHATAVLTKADAVVSKAQGSAIQASCNAAIAANQDIGEVAKPATGIASNSCRSRSLRLLPSKRTMHRIQRGRLAACLWFVHRCSRPCFTPVTACR
jgi:hypothetical protein